MPESILTALAIKSGNAVAGILGGLTSWLIDKDLHWRDGVALVVIGGASSFYLIPALEGYLHLTAAMASFCAYTTGIISRAFIVRAKDRYIKALVDKGEQLIK